MNFVFKMHICCSGSVKKNVHLKLRWPSCSCNCRIEIQAPNWVMPTLVHWKFSWSGSASISLHIGNAWGRWFSLLGKYIRVLAGKQWLLEICTCSIAIAPEHHHSCLAIMGAHVFQSMHVSRQLGPYELVCFVQSSYELCAQDVQLRFGFSQNNVQSKLQHFAYDCRAVRVQLEVPKTVLPNKLCSSVSNLCLHAITSAQDLGSVEYWEDLFLVTNEQSRKLDTTRNHVCKTHVRASHTGACYCV